MGAVIPDSLAQSVRRPSRLALPVLQIIHRAIATFLFKQTGQTRDQAATGAVTLIQRFGSAANLNIPLHALLLDGVYGNLDAADIAGTPSSLRHPWSAATRLAHAGARPFRRVVHKQLCTTIPCDGVARWHQPPCDGADGIHATPGRAGAQTEIASDPLSWGAGTERETA